jgi:hypothetical protein
MRIAVSGLSPPNVESSWSTRARLRDLEGAAQSGSYAFLRRPGQRPVRRANWRRDMWSTRPLTIALEAPSSASANPSFDTEASGSSTRGGGAPRATVLQTRSNSRLESFGAIRLPVILTGANRTFVAMPPAGAPIVASTSGPVAISGWSGRRLTRTSADYPRRGRGRLCARTFAQISHRAVTKWVPTDK